MICEEDGGECPLHFPCIFAHGVTCLVSHNRNRARIETVIIHLSLIEDELRNLADSNGLSLCVYHVSYLISEY